MEANLVNSIRAALLFSADKYRKFGDGLRRFNDPIADTMRAAERDYRRAAATVGQIETFAAADLTSCALALTARADELNRKVQLLADRCQMQESSVVEHELRTTYAATEAVAALAAGLRTLAPAAA